MKTAIVTGAARGIGLATTHRLLKEGWQVVMVDNDGPELEAASTGLNNIAPIDADVEITP